MPHDHHAACSPSPPAAGIQSHLTRAISQPISRRRPTKQSTERAFHEAGNGTGREEGHGVGPF
jgi:hypothetical protein